MQINTPLSLEELKKVEIIENNEPLVEILETPKLKLLKEHKFLNPFLRKSVYEKLIIASNNLPENYKLLVVTAYRPIEMQRKLWRQRLIQMAKKHPLKMIFSYKKWRNLATKYTSPPGGSSHQTGSAVDVIVIDNNENRLDMGTSLTDFGDRVHTFTNLITENQKNNRKILYEALTNTGFVNYPNEWWHYSYGDRMWAAYSKQKSCIYGPITSPLD